MAQAVLNDSYDTQIYISGSRFKSREQKIDTLVGDQSYRRAPILPQLPRVPMVYGNIPHLLLQNLQAIEPTVEFRFHPR